VFESKSEYMEHEMFRGIKDNTHYM
jgi:hypothetical protein